MFKPEDFPNVIKGYHWNDLFNTRNSFMFAALREWGCSDIHHIDREVTKQYFGSGVTAHKLFRKLCHEQFITPLQPYIDKLCLERVLIKTPRSKKPFKMVIQRSTKLVQRLEKCLPEIIQADKDGIFNITPFILLNSAKPQALKELYGKGLWKKLTKNSLTRNKLLSKSVYSTEQIQYLNSIPLVMLKKELYEPLVEVLKKNGIPYYVWNRTNIRDLRDCIRMAKEVGRQRDVRKLKHIEDLEPLHRDLIRQYNETKDLRDKVNIEKMKTNKIGHQIEPFTVEGVDVVPLTTEYMLREEGQLMHHCVHSYMDSVKNGEYVVFHIKDATIGMQLYPTSGWTVDQIKGKYNARVEIDPTIIEAIKEKLAC